MVSTVLMWLRRRWKWLATCVAAILAAIYLHAEFLDYVAALPAGSNPATTASGYIPLAFALQERRHSGFPAGVLPVRDAAAEDEPTRYGRGVVEPGGRGVNSGWSVGVGHR